MKIRSFSWFSRCFTHLAFFVFLVTACGPSPGEVAVRLGLRAWLDQPVTGYTLPLQAVTLKAHARQQGGGVTEIRFMVNNTLLGSVPTDSGLQLSSASFDWNPSAEGLYRIQAVALNNSGQQAASEISLICISRNPTRTCTGATQAVSTPAVSAEIDSSIKVSGAPNPVSIGARCNPADRIVTFEAYVPDTGGATEVDIHGYLVGATGERTELILALSPGTTAGSYIGRLDLGTIYDGVLGGADGQLEFTLSLLNAGKQWFRTSKPQTIAVRYCGAVAPLQGIVKVGGVPDPVFIGKCSPSDPTSIDFEAGTDIDPGMYDHMDLGYVWFDNAGNWIGTVGEEHRARMTPNGSGGYAYHLDVNTAPAGVHRGGQIRFRAILVSTGNADVAFSEVQTIEIKTCGAVPAQPAQPGVTPYIPPQPAPSCSSYTKQAANCKAAGCYYWSDGSCSENPEPVPQQPPSCTTYTNNPSKCKDASCYYWSDGTCGESPEPAPPTCNSFFKNPDGCKNAGCYYWSDNTCNDYAEPAPPSCASNTNQKDCEANNCAWDDKAQACIP